MLWNTGMLAELRKWHAQMCLRLRPQGHENSVAFDVHCIVLEVCFILAPFRCCFLASKAPGRMKRLFWNYHRNPRTPKGDSRTRRGRTPTPFWESFFIVVRIFGGLGESLAQVWKRMPKRSETRPSKTLKMVFPCTREHSFHFRRATFKLWILSLFLASFGVPLPPFIEISGVLLGVFFRDRIYGCIVIFAGHPGRGLGSPGEGF